MRTDFRFLGAHVNIASRARRRWLVAGIYASFAALVVAWVLFAGMSFVGLALFAAFWLMARLLGGRSYRGGVVPSFEGGDERERILRYRAHYLAYSYLDLLFFPVLLAAGGRKGPEAMAASAAVRVWLDRLPWAFMIAWGILYYTLPQAILLWTGPDIEDRQ
jgi:hypothetical protein